LKNKNKTPDQIDRMILTGGFARHIRAHNAVAIGLVPQVPEQRIEVIGNGSLAGAYLVLTESGAMKTMKQISAGVQVIELNLHDEFQDVYLNALFLPAGSKKS
jgi:uncharacterized 2Fe-2S/4Fe-4S cluster protein (DUF4445 family)